MKWYFEASKLQLNKIVIKIGCQHVLNMEICKQASMCAPLCPSARFLPMDAMACATVRSWNILGHLRRHGLAAQEVFARHARCNTWTPSTKCCCRSCSTDRSNGGRVSGCEEWGVGLARKLFNSRFFTWHGRVARSLLEFAQWKHLSFFLHFLFLLCRDVWSSCRASGVVWTFWYQEQWFKSCLQNKKRFKF